jgi:hypothetical protein
MREGGRDSQVVENIKTIRIANLKEAFSIFLPLLIEKN